MKKLFVCILVGLVCKAAAQDWPLRSIILQKKEAVAAAPLVAPFQWVKQQAFLGSGKYEVLQLQSSFKRNLIKSNPEVLKLRLPLNAQRSITCELVRFSLGNVKFTENNDAVIEDFVVPVSYRGIIKDETTINNVVLTVNEDYLSLFIGRSNNSIQLTKVDGSDNEYFLYNSDRIKFPSIAIDCGTKPNDEAFTKNGIALTGAIQPSTTAASDKCIGVFVDCFDSLYQWRGSNKQQTLQHVYDLFGLVATGFLNEQINIGITTINVWTTDPFRQTSRDTALVDLARYYKDNFWGNICVGLDYSIRGRGRSGIASGTGLVKGIPVNTCPVYTEGRGATCYNDLDYDVSVQNFPTAPNITGQQVYLVMHEIGHLLGAHHTKWCGWQINNNPITFGALDSCGVRTPEEGNCDVGPPPPSTGATIMSYCITGNGAGNFVNYTNGFGPLPGAAIRNFVANSNCIVNCTDCFGNVQRRQFLDLALQRSGFSPGEEWKGIPLRITSHPAAKTISTMDLKQ